MNATVTPAVDSGPTTVSEITAARAAGKINDVQWSQVYGPRVESLLGSPAESTPRSAAELLTLTDVPTATSHMPLVPHETPGMREARDHDLGATIAGSIDAAAAAQAAAQYETFANDAMAPATNPTAYQIPRNAAEVYRDMTPDESATDMALRAAMVDAKLPVFVGNFVAAEVDRVGALLKTATPEQIQAHTRGVHTMLRQAWGEKLDANLASIGNYLADLSTKHPMVGHMLDHPHLLASPMLLQQLLNVIEHQARTAPRTS